MIKQKGAASLFVLLGLIVMAVALPIAGRLAETVQDNRNRAAGSVTVPTVSLCMPNTLRCSGDKKASIMCDPNGVAHTTICGSNQLCLDYSGLCESTCSAMGESCAGKPCCAGAMAFCSQNGYVCQPYVTSTPTKILPVATATPTSSVKPICAGKTANQKVCVGGVLYSCDGNGNTTGKIGCPSAKCSGPTSTSSSCSPCSYFKSTFDVPCCRGYVPINCTGSNCTCVRRY